MARAYTTELYAITQDLALDYPKVKAHYARIGCKLKKDVIHALDGSKSGDSTVAVLTAPVKFVTEAHSVMRKKKK